MRGSIPKVSPALVVACLALAVSLSGIGYAAVALPKKSVGTPQLKTGAVTSTKVRNHSLLRVDFKRGQLPTAQAGQAGSVGPKGDKGDRGEKGDKGDPGSKGAEGAPGITGYQHTGIQVPTNPGMDAQYEGAAKCPAGTRLLGGGAYVSPTGYPAALKESWPRSLSTGDEWHAKAARYADGGTVRWSLYIHAICGKVEE